MSVSDILDQTLGVLRAAFAFVIVYVVVLVGLGVASDMGWLGTWVGVAFMILSFALGFGLHVVMLRNAGVPVDPTGSLFVAYILVSILFGLGVMLGLLLLIIPGLIVATRWTPAYAYLVSGQEGITESLSRAWDETGEHFWPIFLASLLPIVMTFGAAFVYVAAGFTAGTSLLDQSVDEQALSLSSSIASNLIATGGQALGIAIGLAVFLLLDGRPDTLEEVFE